MGTRPQLVVLLGGPAVGKDTITESLRGLHLEYRLFRKIKIGSGRSAGYRVQNQDALDGLRDAGLIISEVLRYGNSYVIDSPTLSDMWDRGYIPVVHTASVVEAQKLVNLDHPKVSVLFLTCPESDVRSRLTGRGGSNIEERIKVGRELENQIQVLPNNTLIDARLTTHDKSPEETARQIHSIVTGEIVVPALTLLTRAGSVDQTANQKYVQRLAGTNWTILVTGSTGRGNELSSAQRERLHRMWSEAVGTERLVLGLWSEMELAEARRDGRISEGSQALLAPSDGRWGYSSGLANGPGRLIAYSHPRLGWVIGSQRAEVERIVDFHGVKVSKIGVEGVRELRRSILRSQAIWHGTGRSLVQSYIAGANAVVVSSLAISHNFDDGVSLLALQNYITRTLVRTDGIGDREKRLQFFQQLARESLN